MVELLGTSVRRGVAGGRGNGEQQDGRVRAAARERDRGGERYGERSREFQGCVASSGVVQGVGRSRRWPRVAVRAARSCFSFWQMRKTTEVLRWWAGLPERAGQVGCLLGRR